jgi:hypothetical protein
MCTKICHLPFSLRSDEEWNVRRRSQVAGTRLEVAGKDVHITPLSDFLPKRRGDEGLDAVVELERERGYLAAWEQVAAYLRSNWRPLADFGGALEEYDPAKPSSS